ncbi:hypothetical protein [Lysinibacillus sp. Ag94]|uniref:hypothetical protein n=1 Tax=Lysinibacillus sp. Ag94 TaxID=2936682 RepID=UPI002010AC1D|nr:hypothetical protein [Lysinibacillus sp. Ag94]UPW81278.1 hypothetical protein MY533_10890 [Lysinibacillus sp. Ag94]
MVQSWGKNLPSWLLLIVAWSTCTVLLFGISTGLIVIDALRLFGFIPFLCRWINPVLSLEDSS